MIALLVTQNEAARILIDVYFNPVPTRGFLRRIVAESVLVREVAPDQIQHGWYSRSLREENQAPG